MKHLLRGRLEWSARPIPRDNRAAAGCGLAALAIELEFPTRPAGWLVIALEVCRGDRIVRDRVHWRIEPFEWMARREHGQAGAFIWSVSVEVRYGLDSEISQRLVARLRADRELLARADFLCPTGPGDRQGRLEMDSLANRSIPGAATRLALDADFRRLVEGASER